MQSVAIPRRRRKCWSSQFWPSPSLKRSCSTPCSWLGNHNVSHRDTEATEKTLKPGDWHEVFIKYTRPILFILCALVPLWRNCISLRGTMMNTFFLLAEAEGGGQIQQIARTFGVDWPHLIAQMISFSIVCALLY